MSAQTSFTLPALGGAKLVYSDIRTSPYLLWLTTWFFNIVDYVVDHIVNHIEETYTVFRLSTVAI